MIAVGDIGWFGARAFTDAAALNSFIQPAPSD
jgi:hypothetical protein